MKWQQIVEVGTFVAGVIMIGAGAWMLHPAAGLIAPGVVLVAAVAIPDRKDS